MMLPIFSYLDAGNAASYPIPFAKLAVFGTAKIFLHAAGYKSAPAKFFWRWSWSTTVQGLIVENLHASEAQFAFSMVLFFALPWERYSWELGPPRERS
jgi:hypothetical protein